MNPITPEQFNAWKDFTGYAGDYARAVDCLTGDLADHVTRDSLRLFLAGWQYGYWTDRACVEPQS